MIHFVKKSYFTLLELLIVLFIISFGVILTGVKIKEVYQEQRFLSESQQVLSHLAMAQDLMLIMDTDVQFKMTKNPESKQLTFWVQVEKPLEEAWARFVERKIELSAIQSYEFEGQSDDLIIEFSLGSMSQGILTLFEGKQDDSHRTDKRHFEIELPGYPTPLASKSSNSKQQQKKSDKSQLLYPIEVYEKLYADSDQQDPTS